MTGAFRPGRLVLSLIAVMTAVSPYLADWNRTHIYNPYWPPHAKFHNGQTMLMGAVLGLLALWALWRRRGSPAENFLWGTIIVSLYWITQLGAILFPGAGFSDPQLGTKLPRIGDFTFTQNYLDVILLTIIVGAYLVDRKRAD